MSAMWEEPSNSSGGEPKDLVGFEEAKPKLVALIEDRELGTGFTSSV